MTNYFRMNEWLGDQRTLDEVQNDDERCPFCHSKVETVIGNWVKHADGFYCFEILGCFKCIEVTDEVEEDDEIDPFDLAEWEREKRMLCRGTNYEY